MKLVSRIDISTGLVLSLRTSKTLSTQDRGAFPRAGEQASRSLNLFRVAMGRRLPFSAARFSLRSLFLFRREARAAQEFI
jgi:hypothetical protein